MQKDNVAARSQPGSDAQERSPDQQHSDGPLFADFAYPLRGELEYIEAALSTYFGGPASDDVRGAWERILLALRSAGWRDIASAPKDGTYIDLWVDGEDLYDRPQQPVEISREGLGEAIYLAMYEHQGAKWSANESQGIWIEAGDRLRSKLSGYPLVEEGGAEIAAFLIEQDDEPLAGDLGERLNYWRDKCITAGQRLDPKRWGPK